ncbi:MAG: hypothetical protein ACE5IR_10480 [bacterium]
MRITVDIQDDVFKALDNLRKQNGRSLDEEVENAVLLATKKKALIQHLMNETCDEFDIALKKLA